MSKFIYSLFFICCAMGSSFVMRAQQISQPLEKEIVVVDLFARNRTVPMAYVEAVRQQVLGGFVDRGRHRIIDAAGYPNLSMPPANWGFVDPATAAANQSEFLKNRMRAMMDAGARYFVTGAVSDYKFEHVSLPASGKNPPVPGFRATFQVVLSAYDLKSGKQIPDRVYTLKADAPIAEDADKKAISTLRNQLEFYIDNYFKFETSILQLGPAESRKGAVKELYIHAGSDMGVKNGDLFIVFQEVPIGGIPTRQEIGKLRVNEVQNGSVSKCKISRGNEEIISAIIARNPVICVSDGQALF